MEEESKRFATSLQLLLERILVEQPRRKDLTSPHAFPGVTASAVGNSEVKPALA